MKPYLQEIKRIKILKYFYLTTKFRINSTFTPKNMLIFPTTEQKYYAINGAKHTNINHNNIQQNNNGSLRIKKN